MQDERLAVVDLDELGQLVLGLRDVDVRVAGVAEDAEEAIGPNVEARGLHQRGVVRVDPDPARLDQPTDGAVGENHEAIIRTYAGGRDAADPVGSRPGVDALRSDGPE